MQAYLKANGGGERQVRETVLAPLLETQKPCGQVTCVFMPLYKRV